MIAGNMIKGLGLDNNLITPFISAGVASYTLGFRTLQQGLQNETQDKSFNEDDTVITKIVH